MLHTEYFQFSFSNIHSKMKFIAIFAVFVASSHAEMARFDNYRVYSLKIVNTEQYDAMKYLEEHSDSVEFN